MVSFPDKGSYIHQTNDQFDRELSVELFEIPTISTLKKAFFYLKKQSESNL